jgi:hypothetical protein
MSMPAIVHFCHYLCPGKMMSYSSSWTRVLMEKLSVHDEAALRLSYEGTGIDVWVEFADGVRRTVQLASSSIIWFGRPRTVDLWIARAASHRHSTPDEPLGVIGTGLVSPNKLTIDFMTRRVVITENED